MNFNLASSTDPEAIAGTIQPPSRRSRLAHKRNLNRRGFFDKFFSCEPYPQSNYNGPYLWFPAFTRFDENKTLNLAPIEFSKTLNVLRENVQCPLTEASVNIDVSAEVDAQISLSVIASGSIIPPKLDEFSIITGNLHPLSNAGTRLIGNLGIDATLLGSLDVVANASVCLPED